MSNEPSTPAQSADRPPEPARAAEPPTPRSSWLRRHLKLIVAAALGLVGAIILLGIQRSRDARVEYVTAPVTRGTVAPYVTASGTINPVVTVQVGTYVSGVIQELRCDFNTRVKKQQLCAKIDPRPYQTLVDQDAALLATARAQLAKDQANLEFSQVIYDRDRELLARGIISQETVDTASNALQQARSQIALDKATIQQREAALSASRVNLDYTNIVSPVDGTVVSRNVTQGQTVAASFQTPTLFVIATDLTKMQVDASVSESDIGDIREGNDASFTVEAFPAASFTGKVVQVRQSPQSVQNVVTYDVVSEAPNAELLLKPGMTAAVRITAKRRDDVLRVPVQATRFNPAAAPAGAEDRGAASAHLWCLRDGKPAMVPVKLGLADDAYVEVVAGSLTASDRVIVAERVPGATRPVTAPGQAAPRAPRL